MTVEVLILDLEKRIRSLGRLLQTQDEDAILREIFAVNNDIGRIVMSDPSTKGQFMELQRWVNLMTVGVKSSDKSKVQGGMEGSLSALAVIIGERDAPQKNL